TGNPIEQQLFKPLADESKTSNSFEKINFDEMTAPSNTSNSEKLGLGIVLEKKTRPAEHRKIKMS
ncbi:hypothetical protein OAC51_00820, partial [Flavobacteriaceae bacterium]|nr:hypothetical protein [Flavobacteriaceae bacterium]